MSEGEATSEIQPQPGASSVSYEGAATRTIAPGIGTVLGFGAGSFSVSSNDTATITNNYASVTARQFFAVTNSAGAVTFNTDMSSATPTTMRRLVPPK